MRHYLVIARTDDGTFPFSAIARHCIDAMCTAYDLFGACAVSVRRAP